MIFNLVGKGGSGGGGADVSGVTASAGDVLTGKDFVNSSGTLVHGSMTNRGDVTATIDGLTTTSYTIQQGYHNGSGTVSLTDDIEDELDEILGDIPVPTATVTIIAKNQYGTTFNVAVSGGGEYTIGSIATVIAQRTYFENSFSSWSDSQGNILSTSTTYSFTVTEDATLTALYLGGGGGVVN